MFVKGDVIIVFGNTDPLNFWRGETIGRQRPHGRQVDFSEDLFPTSGTRLVWLSVKSIQGQENPLVEIIKAEKQLFF